MNRLHRELRDDLNRRLNEVVDKIAQEKGISRHEVLKMVKEFLRAPHIEKK